LETLLNLYKDVGLDRLSFIENIAFTILEYDDFQENIPLLEKINDKIIQKILFPVEYAIYVKEILNKELNER